MGQLEPSDNVRFKLLDLKCVIRDKQSVEEEIQVTHFDAGPGRLHAYDDYTEPRLEPVSFKIDAGTATKQSKVQYRMGGD